MTNEQILKKAKENPEHILCLFTKDNFKLAKAFWGEEVFFTAMGIGGIPKWTKYLQRTVLEEKPLKYLKKFI